MVVVSALEEASHLTMISVEKTEIDLDPSITLSVTPTELVSNGDWVTVEWNGIESRTEEAYIAAYSPGGILDDQDILRQTAPVKYQFLSAAIPTVEEEPAKEPAEEDNAAQDTGDGDVEHRKHGSTSLDFRLLNLRDEDGYKFGLFIGGMESPKLVAKTEQTVKFAQPYEVLHPHISLAGPPGMMRISWTTGEVSTSPAARFRKVATALGMVDSETPDTFTLVTAETSTYTRDDMCGEPATGRGFHKPGLLHSAVLEGLIPGETYQYMVGDSEADEWGRSAFFRAPPSAMVSVNAARKPNAKAGFGPGAVKVALFGDMGTAEPDGSLDAGHKMEVPALRTMKLLQEHMSGGRGLGSEGSTPELGLVLHIGDLSYARGYDTQWDEFMDQISPVASMVPWMVAQGNHERDFPDASTSSSRPTPSYYVGYDSGGECGVPTSWRFLMPGPAARPELDTPWYGIDFGPVHFTVMSTEHDWREGSAQRIFLKEDFASVNRTITPFLVLAGHRPMYVSSGGPGADECAATDPIPCSHDQPVARLLRSELEPLMMMYGVDLALWGHHHSYQRSCKVLGEECRGYSSPPSGSGSRRGGTAPMHAVVGMAGMSLSRNLMEPRPQYMEYTNANEWGIAMMEANATSMHVSFLLDVDGQSADDFWLSKPVPSAAGGSGAPGSTTAGATDLRIEGVPSRAVQRLRGRWL
ncbi:unnamed protein product [Discosporangium mesarthrocarpum]